MTDEIKLAFAHPLDRSEATAAVPCDRLSLRDHIVEVEIGAFQVERDLTQRVKFNIVVELKSYTGPLDDDVDRILSYDALTEAVAIELAAERLNLLETLAERVADRILLEPQALRVFVRIEKLDRGPFALGVEIVRDKKQSAPTHEAESTAVPPRVVFLSNAALASENLSLWLAELQSDPVPAILCVEAANTVVPTAQTAAAQRHIDLLAIEQNAWVLAALDQRCAVVETRTELDWTTKNNHISVWAPGKIVLDFVANDGAVPSAPLELAKWFSEQLNAVDFVAVGDLDVKTVVARLVSETARSLLA
ncbi:dihydroneopterin aldolase [Cochlodiniinecator piscidefendens]|uniref:dihydroneopterin aldolase n=1 Tax=Cochlodiniinecator piscidefendens TaxID=2715756 RepID=UPI0014095D35|nr:dihydroneopterin aldolase [Cochlodiniinecator piscidefendens]